MRTIELSSCPQARTRATGGKSLTAAVLCALLAGQPLVAAMHSVPSGTHAGQMQGEQQILHALNRLTFGPRPDEAVEVERIGLQRWFEQQLNPQSIDDSALDSRLAVFPAMALPQQELIRRYPSPQMLRAIIKQGDPLPRDPIEHAIYADGIAFYKDAQAKKAAAPTTASGAAAMPASPSESTGSRTAALEPTNSVENPAAQQKRSRGRKVDLLAGDSSEYTMPGKKKGATSPADAMQATMEQDEAGARGANRGRRLHDESAFPEATTAEILALPPEARVRRILALEPAQLVDFRRSLTQEELAAVARDLTPQQKEIFAALQGSALMIGAEVLESRLERDVYSRREVQAVMTDFWLNHFNVYIRKNQNEPYLLPAYERESIRPHALGRFEDLLVATAKSPAMLMYLDNWQSIGPDSDAAHRGQRFGAFARNPQVKQALKDRGLNENYARELMELHTLGVNCEVSKDHTAAELDPACGKGYTQADVTELAKVFSGWTIDRPNQGGEFQFEERRHEAGKKMVLGQTIHENGEKEGLEVLHMLAMSPATAKFISTKLAVRFVSDTPPPALIDRMAKSYLSSGSDIRAVLRTMFHSPEFWSPEVYRAKVKTPLEFVTSALRATDADVTNAVPVVQSLDRLGMPLYGMQTPNGYSWQSEPWVSTGALVSRMNFALVLSGDKLPGTRTDWPLLVGEAKPGSQAQTVAMETTGGNSATAAKERRLEHLLLGEPASDRTRKAVLAQSADSSISRQAERDFLNHGTDEITTSQGNTAIAVDRQEAVMAGLLLGSPEFQRR